MRRERVKVGLVGAVIVLLVAITAGSLLGDRVSSTYAAPSKPARGVSDAGVDATADAAPSEPPAHTGPHCVKGCPCGDSCISCKKTCNAGPGTAWK